MNAERRGRLNGRVDGGGGMAFLALPMTAHRHPRRSPKDAAAGMLAALADDPLIGERTIDASEVAPGRWEVIVYFDERAGQGRARGARPSTAVSSSPNCRRPTGWRRAWKG